MKRSSNRGVATALLTTVVVVAGLVGLSAVGRAEEKSSPSFWDKTKVSGQMNGSYNWNFNNPPVGAAAATAPVAGTANIPTFPTANNMTRVFDYKNNSFTLNLIDFVVENAPNDWSKFRFDLNLGSDVAVVDSTKGGVIGTDEIALQQAYAELTAPVGKGITFKVGHFVTLLGYEVIESASNWNTSRSMLFGFAIPFTHTGVLATYPFSDKVSGTLGVVNGWDLVADNNKGKSIIGQLTYKATDTLNMSIQGIWGPEQAALNGNYRTILDYVATWTPQENFSLGLNYDFGKEPATVGADGIVNWQGGAVYAHFKPFDFLGATLRAELFQDDGSRIAAVGAKATYAEGTGTLHFYMGDGWETRFELRHDWANASIFTRSTGATRRFQDTASAELVYAF